MSKVLVIAAHPDDEILGCGGTIAKYIKDGCDVYVCIVGEGSSGRFENTFFLTPEERTLKITTEIKNREKSAIDAAKLLGVKDVYLINLPNLGLYLTPQVKINKLIEDYMNTINPDIVLTHTKYDLNLDHVAVHNSTMVAARNIDMVMTYEIIGSTTIDFKPNTFIDIKDTFETKRKALKFYQDEMKTYPQPRSLEGIEILGKYRGINSGLEMAEAFKLIRSKA